MVNVFLLATLMGEKNWFEINSSSKTPLKILYLGCVRKT